MRLSHKVDRQAWLVFGVAYLVRLVYVFQIRSSPYFDVPLVDGPNYFRMGEAIAAGQWTGGHQVFWQPPLYSYFLAILFATIGTRMAGIYAVQGAIGALSCVLVFRIGRRLFSPRAGLAAGLIAALYAPLIHFDAQPLIPVLHIFLVLAGLLMMLRAAEGEKADGPGRRRFMIAGLFWGLAATATPNVLLAVPAAAAWAWRRGRSAGAAGLLLAGVAVPVLAVTARNYLVAGETVLISGNGGINFFIGNNPDYERTIRLRPGGEFERLAQEPENLGIVTATGRSRYFSERGMRFLLEYPREALRLYARKTLDLIAGREIPRNQDPYEYRRQSSLFAILLWRFGVAFPFGVVAPMALAGFVAARGDPEGPGRSGGRLLLAYAAAYALSVVVFFPTDRYRLPLVPVAALYAGRFLAGLPSLLRGRRVQAALLAGLVIFNLDASRAGETFPEEEALNRAYALRMKGRREEARAAYLSAVAINPGRIDSYNSLAAMAAEEGRWDEARERYAQILEIAPEFADVRRNLGEADVALGRRDEARREWETAVRLAPGLGLALADLCLSYYDDGAPVVALPYCERGVGARPDLPETHFALGMVARALRQRDRARSELQEAVRLFPAGGDGRKRAEEILEKMRRRDERQGGIEPEGGPSP